MAVSNMSGDKESGYEFVEKVSERFICNICTKVQFFPHLTGCCGQHFCESCLLRWFRNHTYESCPHCRAYGEEFQHVVNKERIREIKELMIYCTKKRYGCEWVGSLGSLLLHLDSDKGCNYMDVRCECGEVLMRKDLATHSAEKCPLRSAKCEYCNKEDTYQEITEKHYGECPLYPLDCPNRCGVIDIKRRDLSTHCSRCPLEPMECPFQEAGCEEALIRQDFDCHMKLFQQQHLLMVMGAFKETKKRLQSLEAMKEVIAVDVEILHKRKSNCQVGISLASIRSQTKTCRLTAEFGDSITYRMTNFSNYKESGNVWHSPPFYYDDGYKMCLEVHAGGVGSGAGTHVSLSLLLMKGEFDDQLEWPLESCEYSLDITLLNQRSGWPYTVKMELPCECHRDWPGINETVPAAMGSRLLQCIERLIDHQHIQNIVFYDSVVVQISLSTSIGCDHCHF